MQDFAREHRIYIFASSQVGKNDVDILIVPGDEPSKGNTIIHTEYSAFRALENGCSMLRTTLEGLTMGLDCQGRVLSQMNFYNTLNDSTVRTESFNNESVQFLLCNINIPDEVGQLCINIKGFLYFWVAV
jgi:hypothetical protein